MAQYVYSTFFLSGLYVPEGRVVYYYTVPAGFTAVIRQITCSDASWDTDDQMGVYLSPYDTRIFATPSLNPLNTDPAVYNAEGRWVQNQDGGIGLEVYQGNWTVYVGGYLLTNP